MHAARSEGLFTGTTTGLAENPIRGTSVGDQAFPKGALGPGAGWPALVEALQAVCGSKVGRRPSTFSRKPPFGWVSREKGRGGGHRNQTLREGRRRELLYAFDDEIRTDSSAWTRWIDFWQSVSIIVAVFARDARRRVLTATHLMTIV